MLSLSLIQYQCNEKSCISEKAEYVVPLERWRSPTQNLTIPVIRIVKNRTLAPIVFLGPGFGSSNLPGNYDFAADLIPDNPLYFIGYRGIDSKPSPINTHMSAFATLENRSLDENIVQRIANKTLEGINISEFWIPQRGEDVISVLKDSGIEYFNIFSIGESGSRIAHYIAANYPNMVVRIAMAAPSVAIPHNDTTLRLLAVYRRLCRRDPACPYNNVQWLPDPVPKTVLAMFKVSQDRVEWTAGQQLRNPYHVAEALEMLQAVTDGSSFGFLGLTGLLSPDTRHTSWVDLALHACSTPEDRSLHITRSLRRICPYIPNLSTVVEGNISQPLLLINGEFDLPRPNTAREFYKSVSLMPSLVDQLNLTFTSAKYDTMRPDVIREVLGFFNDGRTEFSVDPAPPIQWKNKFSYVSGLKWGIIISVVISAVGSVFVFKKASKEEREEKRKTKSEELEAWRKAQEAQDAAAKKNAPKGKGKAKRG